MRKTKIVGTLGPASNQEPVFREVLEAGLNVVRLNFSHGSHEEHGRNIDLVKRVRTEMSKTVAIMLDTKGPEIRVGKFKNPEEMLTEGNEFILTTEPCEGDEAHCSVSYENLHEDVTLGDKILIDDGLVELEVLRIEGRNIHCRVNNSGVVKDNKSVNVPGVSIQLPPFTERDYQDILFGIEQGVDFIAASFVRKASDVLEIRRILEENNGSHIRIISKIENQEGVTNLEEIIDASDGIMVARGDLGVEIPAESVPLVQKRIIRACNQAGKPVITATQMLDSMIRNPRPTRAEVADVANAIFDGTDAIMLSGETAAGKYPVEAIETMVNIAGLAENSEEHMGNKILRSHVNGNFITDAISHATCAAAEDLKAKAILTATSSGYTATMVSRFRPSAPIIAATNEESVARRMILSWGVYPITINYGNNTDEMFEATINGAMDKGFIDNGDLVVITAGIPVGVSGSTNMLKVEVIGDVTVSGTGVGRNSGSGKICIANTPEEARGKFKRGDILVAVSTDADMVPYIKNAAGLIVEEGGFTSHAAISAINCKIPAIIGVKDATKILRDGSFVGLNVERGLVYNINSNK